MPARRAAAEAAGDRDKARQHYAKLVELTREADTALPEIARAKTYLARAVKRTPAGRGLRSGAAAAAGGAACAVQSDDGDDQALLADADYAAGRAALKAARCGTALRRYQAALKRFPDAADLHNELGFTHRKLRQIDKAFEHYKRALALKPAHRGAHEYIGEAYLMVGEVASAQKHLEALRKICLLPCEELEDLRKAIAAHQAQGKGR